MLRLFILQNLYDLSDEGTVAEVIDSRAFFDFCGMDSRNQVPNGNALGRFCNQLVRNGVQERLFVQVIFILMECDLILEVMYQIYFGYSENHKTGGTDRILAARGHLL